MKRHVILFKLKAEKKSLNEEKAKDQAYLDKWNLDIKLVKEDENDIKIASLYKLNGKILLFIFLRKN